MIHHGDCLDVMSGMDAESIDMIYLDPPFLSDRVYSSWKNGVKTSFSDKWKNMDDYMKFMTSVLIECNKVLKPTGCIFVHLDYHASHYVKVVMDKIFDYKNFLNEIHWKRSFGMHTTFHKFLVITDNILFYKKPNFKFNQIMVPMRQKTIDSHNLEDEHGKYRTANMSSHKAGSKYAYMAWNGTPPPAGRSWVTPKKENMPIWAQSKISPNFETMNQLEKCQELDRIGLVVWSKNNVPSRKSYLVPNPTTKLTNIWDDIPNVASMSNERLGYPTQKPVKLLERIIRSGSNEGDLILDPFMGSGTTLEAAYNLHRKYIGIDKSADAVKTTKERLAKIMTQKRLM